MPQKEILTILVSSIILELDYLREEVEAMEINYKGFNRTKKITVEETHTRDTYMIKNELLNKLNKQSKKEGKGYKKWFANEAFKLFIDCLEKKVVVIPADKAKEYFDWENRQSGNSNKKRVRNNITHSFWQQRKRHYW